MALQFPTPPDTVFDRPPLKTVVCQIQFPPIYALLGDSGVVGFQEALRRDYPSSARIDGSQVAMTPGRLMASQKAPTWRFTDKENNWSVSVGVNFVALDTRKNYTHFGDFIERFEAMLDVLERTVHPDAATRVGLRKLNEMHHPSVAEAQDWRGLLQPRILGPLSDEGLPGQLGGQYAETRLTDENGDELVIRHGVVAEQSLAAVLGGPTGGIQKETEDSDLLGGPTKYILDFDYATTRPYEVAPGELLPQLLTDMSNSMSSLFLWCLEESLYDFLGPRKRNERTQGVATPS